MASESSHHCYWQMEFDLNKAFHVHWKKCLVFPAEKLDISRWRLNLVGFNPVLQIAPKSLPFVLQRPPGSGLLHRNLDSVHCLCYYSICSLFWLSKIFSLQPFSPRRTVQIYLYIVQIAKKYKERQIIMRLSLSVLLFKSRLLPLMQVLKFYDHLNGFYDSPWFKIVDDMTMLDNPEPL